MKELREAIESAAKEEVSAAAEPVETVTIAPEQETETHVEPEHAESDKSVEDAEVDQPAVGETEKESISDKVDEKPNTPYGKAPASWKGDAKEVWNALPEQARREVVRREKQVNQVLQETADIRQNYQAVQQVAQEFEPKLREWNAQPAQVMREFMVADHNLSSGPMENRAAYMARLIKEYGIDVVALDNALSGEAPAPQVDVMQQVEAIVNQRLAPFQQRFQAEEQAQTQKIAATIQAMENNPKYPHFEDVREEMADLIEMNMARGNIVTLDEAYNRVAGYRGYPQPQSKTQNTQKALNASVSVGGSPSTVVNSGNPQDLRGTILSALEGGRT